MIDRAGAMRHALGALLLLVACSPVVALAQQPARSIPELRTRVKIGDVVFVIDGSGIETKGKVETLSDVSVGLNADGVRRDFVEGTFTRIDRRRRDSVRNGLLIGLGSGAVVGFLAGRSADSPACPRSGIECGQGALLGTIGGSFWGAVSGWLVDTLVRRREVLFLAPAIGASQLHPSSPVSEWLSGAATAMGGEAKLRALSGVETSGVSVWYHREQSERPEGPWLTSFTDFTDVRSFGFDTVRRTSRARGLSTNDWIDSTEWTAPSTLLVTSDVSVSRAGGTLTPTGTPPDLAVLPVGLAPERVIQTAREATDLHAEPDEIVDGYPHHVVAFSFAGARIRLILNVPSLLPKAIEIRRSHDYNMYLAPWGDVTQRVTFGMWAREPDGWRYPRFWEFSTERQPDGSTYITRVRSNPPIDAGDFELGTDLRRQFIAARPRIADLPFGPAGVTDRPVRELAPGIVKVPNRFDIIEVKQDDGIVIIEAPQSSSYSAKAIADVRRRFGDTPIKAVVTTSDAWPHIGGIREYVALGIPVYALDLNVPILTRLLAARYESSPDTLARAPRAPHVTVVSGKTTVGAGPNRFEIHPLRTATGERQMMIYWPDHQLLYTSDLFTIRGEFVFLPQQVSEAVDAVARERLTVTTAFGMHYDPLPWTVVQQNALPPRRAPH